MAIQLSIAVRNLRLNQIEIGTGTVPKLRIFSGTVTADCAAADPTGQLAEFTLPTDWMADAASGQKAFQAGGGGSWSIAASAPGTAQSFRIKDSAGTTCHLQGTVTVTGGGGDLTLDNTNIASGQTITITAFTLTDGNV
jgi:hypothetical protein